MDIKKACFIVFQSLATGKLQPTSSPKSKSKSKKNSLKSVERANKVIKTLKLLNFFLLNEI
jgi:hypothetical protein